MANESGDSNTDGNGDPISYSERGKLGGRPRKVSANDVINAALDVVARTGRSYVKTREIVEHPRITAGEQAVRNRLNELVDDERMTTDTIGPARIWFPEPQNEFNQDQGDA